MFAQQQNSGVQRIVQRAAKALRRPDGRAARRPGAVTTVSAEILEGRQLLSASPTTPDFVFPDDAGVIDLTNWNDDPALNVDPAAGNDDTAALQAALDSLVPPTDENGRQISNGPSNINRILYLPEGEYEISEQLTVPIRTSNRASVGAIIQGQNRDKVTIKVKDNIDFDGAAILYEAATADGFRNAVRDLTIDVGVGNPDARGLWFIAHNNGIVSNVHIQSSDPEKAGRVGLELGDFDAGNGPLLIENVSVDGFDVGIHSAFQVASQAFEDISISHQRRFGWVNEGDQNVFVRNLTSINEVRAIQNGPDGTNLENSVFTLVDSTLQGIGDAADESAIYTEERFYGRNVATPGYERAIFRVERNGFLSGNYRVDGDFIKEYWSQGAIAGSTGGGTHELFAGSPDSSLGLDIEDAPDVPLDTNLDNWASPASFVTINEDGTPSGIADDNYDDTRAIQAAIDSGATTLYLPFGRWLIERTVHVRGNVERIHGMESTLGSLSDEGGFRFGDDAQDTIVIERMAGREVEFEHDGDTTLVVRNLQGFVYVPTSESPGDLFIYDVVQGHFTFRNQNVWARQLNVEGRADVNDPLQPDQKILVDNANVWVLGLKLENEGTVVRNINGGNVELLGVYRNNTNPSDADNPAFVTVDASTSVVNFDAATAATNAWTTWVSETRDGVTRTSDRFGGNLGHVYSGFDNAALWDVRQEIVIDNLDEGVVLSGDWDQTRTFPGGYLDENAIFTRDAGATATFTADLPVTGEYEVFARWINNWGGQDHTNHHRQVPITVSHAGGDTTTTVNQSSHGGQWISFGTFEFAAGANGSVTITNDGSDGNRAVIADGVRFVLKSTDEPIPVSPEFAIQPQTDTFDTNVYSGGHYDFNVLENDVAANEEPLVVTDFTAGRGGTLAIGANGHLTYAAHPFFTGWDRFEYTVSNGRASTVATVQVFVEDARDESGHFRRELTTAEQKEAAATTIEGVRVVEYDGDGRASRLLGPGRRTDDIGVSGFPAHAGSFDDIHFGGPRDATITLDLGGTYQLETARLWNFNQLVESRFFQRVTDRGATGVRILVDADADGSGSPGNFALVKTVDLAEATGRNDYTGEVFALEGVQARFVRLEIVDSWVADPMFDAAGLSEVEFRGELVSPASVVEVPNVLVGAVSSKQNNDRPAERTLGFDYNELDNFQRQIRNNSWRSAADDPTPQITYDLNDEYELGSLRLWNINWGPEQNRGAKTIDLSTSLDGENFTFLQTIQVAPGPNAAVDHGEVFELSGVRARHVKLDITATHGATDGAGLGEIRFFGAPVVALESEIPVAAAEASSDFASTIAATFDESGLTEDGLRHQPENPDTPEFVQYIGARNDLTPTVTYRLAQPAELTKFRIWNFAAASRNGFAFNRGVRQLRVLTSENGTDFIDQGLYNVRRGFTSSQYESLNFGQPVRASHVRFEVMSNHGNGSFTGFGEVKFFGTAVSSRPTIWSLDGPSDLGFSSSDRLTSLNNGSVQSALSFRVADVLPGDTVRLYADGRLIGQGVADAYLATITTDGLTLLADGPHQITATRTRPGERESAPSEFSLPIEIETVSPRVVVGEPDGGLALDTLDIVFSEAVAGFDLADLLLQVDGTDVPLDGATLEPINDSHYQLTDLRDVTNLAGRYSLSLASDDTGITDIAGNTPAEFREDFELVARTRAFHSRNRHFSVIPHEDRFLLDSGTVTLTFNTTNPHRGTLLSKDHSYFGEGGHLMIELKRDTVRVRLQSTTQSWYLQGGHIESGVDYDLSFSWGEGGMVLTLNGQVVATNDHTGGLGATSGGAGNREDFVIGANAWKSSEGRNDNLRNFFTGRISDVRVADGAGRLLFSEAVTPYDFGTSEVNYFNGVDQFLEVGHTSEQELATGAIELTFNTLDATKRQTLFSKDNTGFDGGGHLTASIIDGRIEIRLQSSSRSYYLRSEAIASGADYDFRFEFGTGGMKLYLNGTLISSNDYEGGLVGNDNALIIGASQWRARDDADRLEYYFQGTLGDFRLLDSLGQQIDLFGDEDEDQP